jgi:indolepyruvate ferredoxin oxidoreductase
VRAREVSVLGSSDIITPAVATNLFKLMAYKDEYEVARLSLDPTLERELKEQSGDDVSYSFKLHPPVLRAAGLNRKISLATWFKPGFKGLYAMRRVRGTALDPFGRGEVRATERALITEHVAAIDEAMAKLDSTNLTVVAEIAGLPDMIRGYEHVKLANVTKYRAQLIALRNRVRS